MSVEVVGIAAFSYSLRKKEPGPCNRILGSEVMRAVRFLKYRSRPNHELEAAIGSQWEVALAFHFSKKQPTAFIVREHRKGKEFYLDSNEVWAQIKEEFQKRGVKRVIVIANPFLHLTYCKHLVRNDGFELINFKIRSVGFDKLSTQPGTRGPLRMVVYSAKRLLCGHHHGIPA